MQYERRIYSPPMTITAKTIEIEVLDSLASWLSQQALSIDIEEVFVLIVNRGRNAVRLESVPNRAPDPTDKFVVHTRDLDDLVQPDDHILGAVHTHLPWAGNEKPSPGDHKKLPEDMIGGVYMIGHDTVYWYDSTRIVRHSKVKESPSPLHEERLS